MTLLVEWAMGEWKEGVSNDLEKDTSQETGVLECGEVRLAV